jgi:hypothetical protein
MFVVLVSRGWWLCGGSGGAAAVECVQGEREGSDTRNQTPGSCLALPPQAAFLLLCLPSVEDAVVRLLACLPCLI